MAKNGFNLIDAEMHVIEPPDLWTKRIDPEFKDRAPRRINEQAWDIRTVVDGQMLNYRENGLTETEENWLIGKYSHAMRRNFDAGSQLEAMDVEGLDMAVMYPTSGFWITGIDGMDPRLAAASCRVYNDWLGEFCATDPSRMFGVASVSPHDVASAVEEVRRAVTQYGMKAIFLRPNVYNGRSWHDPYYDPLWATAQELDVAVGFHESGGSAMPEPGSERFRDMRPVTRISVMTIELMLTTMDLILGGVLERFPRLRVVFLEGSSGWLPFWLDRIDGHYELKGTFGEMDHLGAKPSDYFKRQCFITMDCDDVHGKYVADTVGDDYLVTTTDYPHGDAHYPGAMDEFLKLSLSDENKRKILWDNPKRLYKL